MTRRSANLWWFPTIFLLSVMCLAAAGMALEGVFYADTAGLDVLLRFAVVAALPFVCAAFVALLRRRGRSSITLFAFSVLAFIVFVGAVDWANGRQLYSWVSPPLR